MAVAYLTDEWAQTLTEALNQNESVRNGIRGQKVLVQFNVTGGPRGDVNYYYDFDGENVTVAIGQPDREADASITMPYATAVSVSSGVITGQSAMSGGQAKASGNVMKVMSLASAMSAAAEIESDLDVDY